MGSADYTAVKELADETSLPVLIAGDADQAGTRGVGAAIEALIDVGIRASMWLPATTRPAVCWTTIPITCANSWKGGSATTCRVVMLIGRTSDSRAAKELWCTSPIAPSGMEYELAGEGEIRWSRFECGACLNCIAWRKKQISDRWHRARKMSDERSHTHIRVTGLKPSQTQEYTETRAAAMSALRKRTRSGPWHRYTARDWDARSISSPWSP